MKRRSVIAIMTALLAFAGLYPAVAVAQYEGLKLNSRIRVTEFTLPGNPQLVTTGYLRGVNDGNLVIVNESKSEKWIPQDEILKLETVSGTRSHGAMGFVIGAAAGGVLGIALGAAGTSDSGTIGGAIEKGTLTVAGVMIGIPIGGLIGLMVGLNTVTEQWQQVEPVYPAPPIAASGYPVAALPRVGIRISF
jgi:hypothetical protein